MSAVWKPDSVIVRYGEISLKGRNRIHFEKLLVKDIRRFLKREAIPFNSVSLFRGRIYIDQVDRVPELQRVFGIFSYSPALKVEKDLTVIREFLQPVLAELKKHASFRISCQRIDKKFPLTSIDVEREIGQFVVDRTGLAVNLEHPEVDLNIEIGTEHAYIFFQKIKGFGGFPFGSAGKLLALFSGGIDSPVAVFMMMKRGVEPVLLHYRVTDDSLDKVYRLKAQLEKYTSGRELKLLVLDRDELFSGRFSAIHSNPRLSPYLCVMCKYLMHRKAGETAAGEGALGIITGDNLAQVASQTLKNLLAYHGVSGLPVYSPLIALEKQDIIEIARRIGTFDLSTAPATGCVPPARPHTGVNRRIFLDLLKEVGLDYPDASEFSFFSK